MLNDASVVKNESETDDFGNKDKSFHPETIVIINCVLNAPLMLASITGNSLLLAAILRTPSLRSSSTVFLCSLAVSDLLVGLVVQPVYISNRLKPGGRLLFPRLMLSFSACGVSLCTMAAISVDRFLALHCHMRYPNIMTTRRAIYMSAALWLSNIIFPCLVFGDRNRTSFLLAMAIGIAACLLISTFSYTRIYFVVRRHQLQIHAQQQAVESLNAEHNLNMQRSKKSALNTFIYYTFMILCYSPLFICMLIFTISPKLWTSAWLLADSAAFINSAINPCLYYWRNRELRTAVVKTLRNVLCNQTGES